MSTRLEHAASAAIPATQPARQPRRSFLRWAGRGALASILAVGGVLRSERPAAALYQYACCYLARPHSPECPWDCNLFHNYTIRSWTCCYRGYLYVCSECTSGSTCYQGRFLCSYYYRTSTRC